MGAKDAHPPWHKGQHLTYAKIRPREKAPLPPETQYITGRYDGKTIQRELGEKTAAQAADELEAEFKTKPWQRLEMEWCGREMVFRDPPIEVAKWERSVNQPPRT
jgi:hypothetical protein